MKYINIYSAYFIQFFGGVYWFCHVSMNLMSSAIHACLIEAVYSLCMVSYPGHGIALSGQLNSQTCLSSFLLFRFVGQIPNLEELEGNIIQIFQNSSNM